MLLQIRRDTSGRRVTAEGTAPLCAGLRMGVLWRPTWLGATLGRNTPASRTWNPLLCCPACSSDHSFGVTCLEWTPGPCCFLSPEDLGSPARLPETGLLLLPSLGTRQGQERSREAHPTGQSSQAAWDPGGRVSGCPMGSSYPQVKGKNRKVTEERRDTKVTTGNVQEANTPSQTLSHTVAAEPSMKNGPLVTLCLEPDRTAQVWAQPD